MIIDSIDMGCDSGMPLMEYVSTSNNVKSMIDVMPNVFSMAIDELSSTELAMLSFGKLGYYGNFFYEALPHLYVRAKTHGQLKKSLHGLERYVGNVASVSNYNTKGIISNGVLHVMRKESVRDILIERTRNGGFSSSSFSSSVSLKDKDLFSALSNDLVDNETKLSIISKNPYKIFHRTYDISTLPVELIIGALEMLPERLFQKITTDGKGITMDAVNHFDFEVTSYIIQNEAAPINRYSGRYTRLGTRWKLIKATAEYWQEVNEAK